MSTFFNPDNFLWQWMGKLADFVILSCVWVVGCFGVVTIGPSCIALYDVTAHCVRGKEDAMFARFIKTFKRELKPGIMITLFWGILAVVIGFAHQYIAMLGMSNPAWNAVAIVIFFLLTIPIGILSWTIALQSRFTYTFWGLHRNALLMTFAYLPRTFMIVVLFVIVQNLCIRIPFLLMVLPCLMTTIQSLFIEPVLAKYMPAEADGEDTPTEE